MREAERSGLWRELVAMDRADLALRLLLIGLLFQPIGQRGLRPIAVAVAGLGLLAPGAVRHPLPWIALAGLATARIAHGWPTNDNHAYLLVYWCLAAALAAIAVERDRILAWNARVLIGFTFVFATLWKLVLAPDFLDGRFFAVTLVDDPRFESIARLAVGLGEEQLLALRDLTREHVDGVFVPWVGTPEVPGRLHAVARVMTWSTLAIEASVALSFLVPGAWSRRLRDPLLLAFCASTYALAPVAGFGWILLSMGVAQLDPERRGMRGAYLVVFAWILFATRWPWLRVLADRFAS